MSIIFELILPFIIGFMVGVIIPLYQEVKSMERRIKKLEEQL